MNNAAQRRSKLSRPQQYRANLAILAAENESLVIARNGLHASLCAVLAQRGGEVTITPGTMSTLMQTRMGFTINQGPGEGEVTLRLVEEPVSEVYPCDTEGDDGEQPVGDTELELAGEVVKDEVA